MPGNDILRFDDRVLRSADDGADFEMFVQEYFNVAEPGLRMCRSLVRRPDGGVDLLTADAPFTTHVECKFLGREATTKPADVFAKTGKRLKTNIVAAARGRAGAAIAYRAWLNPELTEYRLCFSALAPTAAGRGSLAKKIGELFSGLSREHPQLAHLADMQVRLWWWDDFASAQSSYPALFYRWFGGAPPGFTSLGGDPESNETFKTYLESSELPYFSRSQFLSEGLNSSDPESEWTQEIIESKSDALVIYGPGGVGKTRLALEIAKRALAAGWLAFRMDDFASFSDGERILSSSANSIRVLLFVDYGERFKQLGQAADFIHKAQASGHKVGLVVSCRSSMRLRVFDELLDLRSLPVDAGADVKGAGDRGFAEWVVAKIINHFALPEPERLRAVCGRLPVLAAFAAFLYKARPDRFREQFEGLLSTQDFQTWANRRLRAIEHAIAGSGDPSELLARLAVRLPMAISLGSETSAENGQFQKLLDILRVDLWVGVDQNQYVAAHDVFADAMVSRFVFAMPGLETERAFRLVEGALRDATLAQTLSVIDRLAGHPSFGQIDGMQVFRRLTHLDEGRVFESCAAILGSRLLSPRSAIILAIEFGPNFREWLLYDSGARYQISALAEWAALSGKKSALEDQTRTDFGELLAVALEAAHSPNIMLRRAFMFDPARYREALLSRIRNEPRRRGTSYLIQAALEYGILPSEIEFATLDWLSEHQTSTFASYVMASWIQAGGEIESIFGNACKWLEANGLTPNASYFYPVIIAHGGYKTFQHWIDKWVTAHNESKGARFVFEALLVKGELAGDNESAALSWIKTHAHDYNANRLLQAWIDHYGLDGVNALVLSFLSLNAKELAASYILQKWLEKDGSLSDVRPHLMTWLGGNDKDRDRITYTLSAWAQHGGDADAVKPYIGEILRNSDDQFFSCRVIVSWLFMGGALGEVTPFMESCLAVCAADQRTRFLYENWLRAGGSADAVWPHAVAWLEANGDKEYARHFYGRWVLYGGDWGPIRPFLDAWLVEHGTKRSAAPMLFALVKGGVPVADVASALQHFLVRHPHDKHSITFLSWVAGSGTDMGDIIANAELLLPAISAKDFKACYTLEALMEAGCALPRLEPIIKDWLQSHLHNVDAAFLLGRTVTSGGDFAVYGPLVLSWLKDHACRGRANLLLRAWIGRGWPTEPVRGAVEAWLEGHAHEDQAVTLYRDWRKSGAAEITVRAETLKELQGRDDDGLSYDS